MHYNLQNRNHGIIKITRDELSSLFKLVFVQQLFVRYILKQGDKCIRFTVTLNSEETTG